VQVHPKNTACNIHYAVPVSNPFQDLDMDNSERDSTDEDDMDQEDLLQVKIPLRFWFNQEPENSDIGINWFPRQPSMMELMYNQRHIVLTLRSKR